MNENLGLTRVEHGLLIGLHTTLGAFLSLPGDIIGQWLCEKHGILIA